jgi:stringent starvation protein B
MTKVTPLNHHLLLAYHNWLVENGARIHLTINGVLLAENDFLHAYANPERRIALSVGQNAVRYFVIDADGVSFNATFNSQQRTVFVPLGAIEGLIGWLPGHDDDPVGFHLPPMLPDPQPGGESTTNETTTEKKDRSHLSVVK